MKEKTQLFVNNIFAKVAKRYDIFNHLFSFNIDNIWKSKVVELSNFCEDSKILDLCTGTADIAIKFAKAGAKNVIAVDISKEMINIGEKKVEKLNLTNKISFIEADAFNLPFAEQSFDIITIGFGIRNLQNTHKAIQKIKPLLKPNGKLLILEFSPKQKGFLGLLFKCYLHYIMPYVAGLITGAFREYKYLANTIMNYHTPQEMSDLMKEVNLMNVQDNPLFLGVAHIYSGKLIEKK